MTRPSGVSGHRYPPNSLFSPVGFIDAFKRWRLARKGLSSGKKRRVQNDDAVSLSLDRSAVVRFSLYLAFCVSSGVMVMGSLSGGAGAGTQSLTAGLYGFFLAVSAVTVVELNHRRVAERNKRVILLLGGLLVHLALIRGFFWISSSNDLSPEVGFLLTPFVVAPMVHAVLLGAKAGVFSAVYASLLGALLLGIPYVPVAGLDGSELAASYDTTFIFLSVSLLSGLVTAVSLRSTRKRVQLLRAGVYAGVCALLLAIVFGVASVGPGTMADWRVFGLSAAAALGMGIGTALLVSGFLPVLEGIFTLTTDISWLELSDLNHRLLRRMQLEAPGTFHHSLVVASLAETAAEAVGANASLCRVCSYFHDVGKLNKPEYFIENQHDGAENPHDSLTPTMSALIIVAHVKDGVDLAIKNHLNPRVIDVIREHHGDSLVTYFYRRAQEQKLSEIDKVEKKLENPEDLPKIDQKNFRYPGPRPRSKESGIISLADAVESASRSLKKPTPAKIRTLVEDIVDARICDGQLDNCELTMRDLSLVQASFCKTLRSMLHSRIDYPKEKKEPKSDVGKETSGERKSSNGNESKNRSDGEQLKEEKKSVTADASAEVPEAARVGKVES